MLQWGALGKGMTFAEMEQAIAQAVASVCKTAKKVLLLPPDITRIHSRAGVVTCMLYDLFTQAGIACDLLPALGTHLPMTEEEMLTMFPEIPLERFIQHDWRNDVVDIGEIPSEYIQEIAGGLVDFPVKVQLNRHIVSGGYDAIYAIGQVVPHEVVGFSSFSKHLMIGCGGWDMINHSHFLGAAVGAENIMGVQSNPVRKMLDYAQAQFASDLPLSYFMTVVGPSAADYRINGLYYGGAEAFDAAVSLSTKLNSNHLDKPIQKAVVYLDPNEYRSTWLGNKAIYRTRMALAKDASLVVLAPGVRMFGEDGENDRLIREFGYGGREKVLGLVKTNPSLADNLSVAAHLIHGSSDGAFSITYAVDPQKMPLEQIESVGYAAQAYDQAIRKYDPDKLVPGFQIVDGEEIFYIQNPALGLWSAVDRG